MNAIEERIAAALEKMRFRRMEPRAIYLTPEDYKAFKRSRSAAWGGDVVPLSAFDVPIISEKLIEQMVPIRESSGKNPSTIYSKQGVGVAVPKRLSARTRLAA